MRQTLWVMVLVLGCVAGCAVGIGGGNGNKDKDSSLPGVDFRPEAGFDLKLPTPDADVGPVEAGTSSKYIYVTAAGKDSIACGDTVATACQTITRGISRAASYTPARWVLVAAGSYYEVVTLVDQVSVMGGYSADFSKGPGVGGTSNIFGTASSGEAMAVKAENLTRATELVAFTIQAADVKTAGKSSYGVYVEDSPNLVLRELKVISGKAGDGVDGTAGVAGESGLKGGAGLAGKAHLLPVLTCGTTVKGGAGWPGDGAKGTKDKAGVLCSTDGGVGGKGEGYIPWGCSGGSGKAVAPATKVTDACLVGTTDGQGGKGGKPGSEGCDGGVTTKAEAGFSGCAGKSGAAGTDGKSGASIGTVAKDGLYAPADGGDGAAGGKGQSGGGGGGGGGYSACSGLLALKWGGGGGGGGAGACGGGGGGGGEGGGASIGIFIAKGYATQKILNCSVTTGTGGNGGKGAAGGIGGIGGLGGLGGKAVEGSGAGGTGGKGGDGGAGGVGGGGGGGPVVGIFIGSGASPTTSGNTVTHGSPGAGGKGAGTANDGAAGKSADTYGP